MQGTFLGGDLWRPGSSVLMSGMLCVFISPWGHRALAKNLHSIHESLMDKPGFWFINIYCDTVAKKPEPLWPALLSL